MITPLQIQIYSSASILEVVIVSSPNNNANINSDGDGNAGRRVCLEPHPAVEVFITGGLPRACPVFENPILEIDSSTNRQPSSESLSKANNSSSYMYISAYIRAGSVAPRAFGYRQDKPNIYRPTRGSTSTSLSAMVLLFPCTFPAGNSNNRPRLGPSIYHLQ